MIEMDELEVFPHPWMVQDSSRFAVPAVHPNFLQWDRNSPRLAKTRPKTDPVYRCPMNPVDREVVRIMGCRLPFCFPLVFPKGQFHN